MEVMLTVDNVIEMGVVLSFRFRQQLVGVTVLMREKVGAEEFVDEMIVGEGEEQADGDSDH